MFASTPLHSLALSLFRSDTGCQLGEGTYQARCTSIAAARCCLPQLRIAPQRCRSLATCIIFIPYLMLFCKFRAFVCAPRCARLSTRRTYRKASLSGSLRARARTACLAARSASSSAARAAMFSSTQRSRARSLRSATRNARWGEACLSTTLRGIRAGRVSSPILAHLQSFSSFLSF